MQYTMEEKSLSPDRSILTLSGRLTAANAGEIKKQILDIVAERKNELLFDLSGVSFLDSSGLSVFVSVLRACREKGGWMKLSGLPKMPADIFRLTLLDRVIDLYPDVESALKAAEEASNT